MLAFGTGAWRFQLSLARVPPVAQRSRLFRQLRQIILGSLVISSSLFALDSRRRLMQLPPHCVYYHGRVGSMLLKGAGYLI